jgi:3-oxoadipate enol-lactonase
MPFVTVGGGQMRYRLEGPAEGPVLVLVHSLGTDLSLWDPQAGPFARQFRVLRYDLRGHGASALTPGRYRVERLAQDLLGLLDALAIPRAHVCGLSIGGMIGLWLGAHASDRVGKLVLANTAARIGTPEAWDARIEAVRDRGLEAIADAVLRRWFTAAFSARRHDVVAAVRRTLLATPPDGYVAGCAAVRDADLRDAARAVVAPVLVIAGTHDAATPPAAGRWLAETIRGARSVELEAAHLSNVEAADRFTATALDFLPP